MQNLAGVEKCDQYIKDELRRCGIEIVEVEKSKGEVPYSFVGKIENFDFHRAWYYWVVEGLVPGFIASGLYKDKVGKTDIRVGGDCGCPDPKSYYGIIWYAPDGREVISVKEKIKMERFGAKSDLDWFKRAYAPEMLEKRFVFSDEPEKVGHPFVDTYHIDSELGLRIFADKIKAAYKSYKMDEATRLIPMIKKIADDLKEITDA